MALKTLPFLIFMFATFMPIKANSFGLKLIPVDSIDSVDFPKHLTLEERHYRLVELSKARVLHLRSMMPASTIHSTEVPIKPGLNMIRPSIVHAVSNYYIAQFFIGTKHYSPYLLVDSGSDITWVQCDHCTNCFPVREGNFKYHESISFHTLPCEHPLCVPKICQYGMCHYDINYGQGGTKGWVGTDTFTFPGINGTYQSIANIVFGCGFDNNISFGLNDGPNNLIAGIFGLGPGVRSMLRQLSFLTKLRFSYCLPSWTAPRGTYTFLHFGDDAKIGGDRSRSVQSTILPPNFYHYYVNMLGLSVEGKRLNIDPALFRLKPDYSDGFFIDSGCPHSILVEPAYRILKEEMVQYFLQRYGWHPRQTEPDEYNLCYNIPPRGNYTLPSMTFHFEGANLFLDETKIFQRFATKICMIIIPSLGQRINLLGAFQQADHRFLFDFEAGRMFFVPENCRQN